MRRREFGGCMVCVGGGRSIIAGARLLLRQPGHAIECEVAVLVRRVLPDGPTVDLAVQLDGGRLARGLAGRRRLGGARSGLCRNRAGVHEEVVPAEAGGGFRVQPKAEGWGYGLGDGQG